MPSRWLAVLGLSVTLLVIPRAAAAAEGDAPSGPEACLVDGINGRRAAAGLAWSGTIQEGLRAHSAEMAATGEIDHDGMQDRVGDLPAGWGAYGETASVEDLPSVDETGVEVWCDAALDALWSSPPHKEILSGSGYEFVSVGVHWDGDRLWITTGVFAHPTYRPAPVTWPISYLQGLDGNWRGRFSDDDGSLFESDIEVLAAAGITAGCNPPDNTRFCPDAPVTRAEMAAFLTRALGWRVPSGDSFVDDDGSVFEGAIEAMAGAGVTEGCNPPDHSRFCPDRSVTRGEMATFLARALGLEPLSGADFVDIGTSVHRANINALHRAGITAGCDATGDRFCPRDPVTRGQMAAFLVRAGLAG